MARNTIFSSIILVLLALPALAQKPERTVHDVQPDTAAIASRIIYPAEALRTETPDEVEVYARVSPDGIVEKVDLMAGAPVFRQAVENGVRGGDRPRLYEPAVGPQGPTYGYLHLRVRFWVQHLEDGSTRSRVVVRDLENVGNPFLRLPEPSGLPAGFASVSAHAPEGKDGEFSEEPPGYDTAQLARMMHYPERARILGMEGSVIMKVLVNGKGEIERIGIIESDHILFELAAVDAVRRLSFTAARQNGASVSAWIVIPVIFSLKS